MDHRFAADTCDLRWRRIDEEKPDEGQPVYYWFGVFDAVCEGFYKSCGSEVFADPDDELDFDGYRWDCFYGKDGGFLCGDVTWWLPRDEMPSGVSFSPAGPTDEQKSACRYHPIFLP